MANNLGFFLGGVREQANKDRQAKLLESQFEFERTKEISAQITQQTSKLAEDAAKIKAAGKWTPAIEKSFMQAAMEVRKSAQMANVSIDPVAHLVRAVQGTPTPVEAAQTEGAASAASTLTQRSSLRAGGLSDRQADAAAGTEPRSVQTQNFINREGDRTFVDMTSPNAPAEVADLKARGYTEFGQSVQATEIGGLSSKEKSDFSKLELSAAVVVTEAENLKASLGDDVFTGWAGNIVRGVSSLAGNVTQLAKLAGGTAEVDGQDAKEADLFNPANYQFESFEGAAESAAFKSNVLNLAYAMARAAEPGGRLSDRDVQIQLDALAAGSGDKAQIEAAIDEAVRRTVSRYGIARDQAAARGETLAPPPQSLRPKPATGDFSSMTLEELLNLDPANMTAEDLLAASARVKELEKGAQ